MKQKLETPAPRQIHKSRMSPTKQTKNRNEKDWKNQAINTYRQKRYRFFSFCIVIFTILYIIPCSNGIKDNVCHYS